MKKILIFGATSAIAESCCRQFAIQNKSLFLYGRDKNKLQLIAKDLKIRGALQVAFDYFDAEEHQENARLLIEKADKELIGFDTVVLAHGILPNQRKCQKSIKLSQQVININLLSMISYLTELGDYFKKKGGGTIVVISSISGDRGRQSNYIYGTSKGGLSLFCQGLRNELHDKNINIITIKPGFIDTPMTAKFNQKNIFWSKPDKIAKDIIQAIRNKSSEVYTPWYWYWIMLLITIIPENIFKRMKL